MDASIIKDGSLVLVSLWVLKDMVSTLKNSLTPQKTTQITKVNSSGATDYVVGALHVEKAIDRFTNAMDKVAEALTTHVIEGKLQAAAIEAQTASILEMKRVVKGCEHRVGGFNGQ